MHSCFIEQLQPEPATIDRRTTILIVEDDSALATVLEMSLDRQGFATLTANSAARAMELCRTQRPAAVLLDLQLPDADGLDVCQELTDDPTFGSVPVIIISGAEDPDVLRKARAAGCQYYLRKPYDPNALLTLIRDALDSARECDDPEFPS
jgi:CheY-like chemotaxis protein